MMLTSALSAAALIVLAAQPTAAPAPSQAPSAAPAAKESGASPFTAEKTESVATGYGFTEGPTWVPGGKDASGQTTAGFFVFCDMGNDKVYRYDNGNEKPSPIREPASRAVGSGASPAGVVYQVDTGTRSVTSWSLGSDGKPTDTKVVADKFNGEPLGGMNDLCVASDGTVWVTHATWFLPRGAKSPFNGVLRIAKDGTTHKAAEGLSSPNGVCLSPDGKTMYVTEYGAGRIQSFSVSPDGTLGEKKLFADLKSMAQTQGIKGGGGADGIRCDKAGNVYSTGPGGVWVLSPSAAFVGHLPVRATNLAFGGADGRTLLITTGSGVVRIGTKTPGAGW